MLQIVGKTNRHLKVFSSLTFKMTTQLLTKCLEISLDKDVDYLEALVQRETQMHAYKCDPIYLHYFNLLNTQRLYSKNMLFFRKV